MSIPSKQISSIESPTGEWVPLGETQLDESEIAQIQHKVGHDVLMDVMNQETISPEEQPISAWAQTYIDSIFGEDTSKTFGLRQGDANVIGGAFMRIHWDWKNEDKKIFYIKTVEMIIEGYSQAQIAKALGFPLASVGNGLSELRRRTVMRIQDEDGQRALLDAIVGEKEGVSYDELPLPMYGKKYIDSTFGKGTAQSLDLRLKDTDIIIGALSRIDWEFEDDERRVLYQEALELLFQGFGWTYIGNHFGFSENKMTSEFRQLQNRILLRIRNRVGSDALAGAMNDERRKAPYSQNWIALKGMKYINSIFGEGVSESLDLRLKEADLISNALVRNIYDIQKRNTFYIDILTRTFQGQDRAQVGHALGIEASEVDIELGEIKRKIRSYLGDGAISQAGLLEMINKEEEIRLNEPFEVQLTGHYYQSSRLTSSPESVDSLAGVLEMSDIFERLSVEGLCQQIDPGIRTGDYVLNSYEVKQVCGMCHLSKMCLEYAIKNNLNKGIWGGRSIRALRREMRDQELVEEVG